MKENAVIFVKIIPVVKICVFLQKFNLQIVK